MVQILSKTILNIKMSHMGSSYLFWWYVMFSYEATKTNIIGQKVAIAEIRTEFTERFFFPFKLNELERYCRKHFRTSKLTTYS